MRTVWPVFNNLVILPTASAMATTAPISASILGTSDRAWLRSDRRPACTRDACGTYVAYETQPDRAGHPGHSGRRPHLGNDNPTLASVTWTSLPRHRVVEQGVQGRRLSRHRGAVRRRLIGHPGEPRVG